MRKKVLTFGTFDLFHHGHLRLLERAKLLGTSLTVGVFSDVLHKEIKGKYPIIPHVERSEIVSAIWCVGDTFPIYDLRDIFAYITENDIKLVVLGDNWQKNFLSKFKKEMPCDILYLERTPSTYTKRIKETVRRGHVRRV